MSTRRPLGILWAHSVQKERYSEKRRFLAGPITCSVSLCRRSRHKIHCDGNRANGRGLPGAYGPVKHLQELGLNLTESAARKLEPSLHSGIAHWTEFPRS